MIAMLGVFNIVGGLYHLTAFAWATVFERCAVVVCLITVALLKQKTNHFAIWSCRLCRRLVDVLCAAARANVDRENVGVVPG